VFSPLALAGVAAHVGGPFFPGLGLIFFIVVPLFFIGLFFLIGGLARRRMMRGGWGHGYMGHGYGTWGSAARSAESTLAERFAQGDIDEKEYRARLEVLRANNTVTPPAAK
jgi:putative membrane protein